MNRNILALVSRHMCRYIAIQPHVVSSKVSRYLSRDTIRVSRSHVSRCIDASMHRYTPSRDRLQGQGPPCRGTGVTGHTHQRLHRERGQRVETDYRDRDHSVGVRDTHTRNYADGIMVIARDPSAYVMLTDCDQR